MKISYKIENVRNIGNWIKNIKIIKAATEIIKIKCEVNTVAKIMLNYITV